MSNYIFLVENLLLVIKIAENNGEKLFLQYSWLLLYYPISHLFKPLITRPKKASFMKG